MKLFTNAEAVAALEEHGHLFQQRCVEEIRKNESLQKFLSIECEEYPVSIGEESSVIDFVLCSRLKPEPKPPVFLVFECKRAHPDYVDWLFPVPHPTDPDSGFLATKLFYRVLGGVDSAFETVDLVLLGTGPKHYVATGLEVSQKKKSGRSSKTETIYQACQQVLTGLGGFALEQHARKSLPIYPQLPQYFVPVVVTTAQLWVTGYKVADVDLSKGTLLTGSAETKSADWVFLDFPVRENLQITFHSHQQFTSLSELRRLLKVKSVAIVNAEALTDFLLMLNLPND